MSYDLGTAHGKITLEYDGGPQADEADDDIRRLQRSSKNADGDLKKFGKTLGKVFGVIGKATAITGLAIGLANGAVQAAALGVQLLGIIPSLVQIGSLVGVIPAALTLAAGAAGVLMAAFVGVGEAIEAAFSGDLTKFNEALEALSPQAREFAQGIRAIVPGLKAVQQGIQNAFFAQNLQDFFPRLVAGLRSLTPQLNGVAGQFGVMGRRVLEFATSSQSISFVNNALAQLQGLLISLTPGLRTILTGLRDVGQVGLDFLEPLRVTVGQLAVDFGEWLTQISKGGQLMGWMQGAAETLGTLKDIVFLFGDALLGVMRIAEQTGGGLLGTLREIALAFNNFVDSAGGQEAIASAFGAILEVARQLAPVFTTLAQAVLSALGPALMRLATVVGPVLVDVVNRLAPALAPVAEALADLLIAVSPLLPVIAQVAAVLATLLAGALTNVSSALGPLIEMFAGTLLSAWETLIPLAEQLATQVFPVVAEAGIELAKAFAPLMPVIVQLAQALVASLLPVLPELAAVFRDEMVPALVQFAEVLANEGVAVLQQFIPLIPILVDLLVLLLPLFASWTAFIIKLVAAGLQLIGWLRQLPGLIIGVTVALVQLIGQGLSAAYNAVVNFAQGVRSFFVALPGQILAALKALPGFLFNIMKTALDRALFAIGFGIGLIIAQVTKMPVAIGKALAALPGIVWDLLTRVWNTAANLVSAGVNRVVAAARALPGRVRSAISSLLGIMRSAGSQAINGMRTAVEQGIARIISAAKALPGKIRSAVGNLLGLLRSAGADLIRGLINGMESLIGRAVDIARNAASRIKDGIASALRIGSPSKVMIQFGRWTVEGLIIGMQRMFGMLDRTASALAQSAIAPTASVTVTPAGVVPATPFTPRPPDDPDQPRTFGPYVIQVGDKTFVEMVVDAVSGVPKVISRVANEGNRQVAWANPGRAAA